MSGLMEREKTLPCPFLDAPNRSLMDIPFCSHQERARAQGMDVAGQRNVLRTGRTYGDIPDRLYSAPHDATGHGRAGQNLYKYVLFSMKFSSNQA